MDMTAANPHLSGIIDAIIRLFPCSVKMSWYHPTAMVLRPFHTVGVSNWGVEKGKGDVVMEYGEGEKKG